jgi:hypothetical protein
VECWSGAGEYDVEKRELREEKREERREKREERREKREEKRHPITISLPALLAQDGTEDSWLWGVGEERRSF